MLGPKYKRYLKQIIPFPIIWLLFASIYSLVEYGILGPLKYYPSTGNQYDFQNNFIFTSLGCIVVGLLQGWIEVRWLRKRFAHRTLWVKIVLKILFYIFFITLFLIILSTMNNWLNFYEGVWSNEIFEDLKSFIGNFAFWSVMIFIGAVLSVAIFFSEISEYLGNAVLYNFLFGKYHRPKQEIRIFMFLDMKSSTTIAEQMGHKKYFDLLKMYYSDMTNAILETSGEIYQYVGDEIVVSWPEESGVYKNNCILCFVKISKAIEKNKEKYLDQFNLIPEFKAGFHIGEITTGEIGIIKKDIIYTGDVLNTTARIQTECNTYDTKTLISEELVNRLKAEDGFSFTQIGKLLLRGKKESVQLYRIEF